MNMRCFMLRHRSSLRGRVWEVECWQLCVEWQSESLLHKATVEAGPALEPELLREEAKKVSLWLSQCQIWLGNAGNGDGARLIFSALCQLNKELCGLLARVERLAQTLSLSLCQGTSWMGWIKPWFLFSWSVLRMKARQNPEGRWDMGMWLCKPGQVCSFERGLLMTELIVLIAGDF